MLDPISEMLTRIKNAQRAGHKEVKLPASNLKMAIAEILEKEKFIVLAKKEKEESGREYISIVLKYSKDPQNREIPAIEEIKRVSTEGQRIYVGKNEIKKVKNGFGISIISTSQGVMAGEESRKRGLGGELICEVW